MRRLLTALSGLAVRLQAITHAANKIADNRGTNRVPLLRQGIH